MSERETALKRPTDDEINLLEKAAWDANADRTLVWERDQRQRLQNERDAYRGALVGLLPMLHDHPKATKHINQSLASLPPAAAPQTCQHCKLPATVPEVCTSELHAVIEEHIAKDWDLLNRGIEIGQSFQQPQAAPQTCEWRETEDGQWETACERVWEFTNGGPEDNDVTYCHGCGKPVVPVVLTPAEEPKNV